MRLERPLDAHLDAGPLLALPALGLYFVVGGRAARRRVGLLEPLGQQRLQLAHVLERQLESFEATNCCLTENVTIQSAQRQPNIGLREAQLDAALLELFGKLLEIITGGRVLFARFCEVRPEERNV